MKKLLALLLCAVLSVGMLASCGGGDEPAPVTPDASTTEGTEGAPAEETPAEEGGEEAPAEEAPAFDASQLTDFAWGTANPNVVGSLTFDGDTASLNILEKGVDNSVSGPYTVGDGTLTIDGTEMTWRVVATFCTVNVGSASYSLQKMESADAAKGPYELLTNSWSGDGMSLSFDGTQATISVDGGINYTGTYSLDNAASLTIPEEGGETGENLAEGAAVEASSMETADYDPSLAVDGDQTTRWASAYEDPSWLTVDLGEPKTATAAIFTFEAAYPTDFEIQGSNDNENWDTLLAVTGNDSGGSASGAEVIPVTFFFDQTGAYQYYRFYGTARATTYGHSFWEWGLYEKVPGVASCQVSYNGGNVSLTLDGTTYNLSK